VVVLVAEVQIEAGPFMGGRALGRWHSRPLPPPLKGCPGFSGNLRHGIMKGSHRLLSGGDEPPSGERRPARRLEDLLTAGLTAAGPQRINASDEGQPAIRGGWAFG